MGPDENYPLEQWESVLDDQQPSQPYDKYGFQRMSEFTEMFRRCIQAGNGIWIQHNGPAASSINYVAQTPAEGANAENEKRFMELTHKLSYLQSQIDGALLHLEEQGESVKDLMDEVFDA